MANLPGDSGRQDQRSDGRTVRSHGGFLVRRCSYAVFSKSQASQTVAGVCRERFAGMNAGKSKSRATLLRDPVSAARPIAALDQSHKPKASLPRAPLF
ncbi:MULTISPECIES: hypothetical protein [unclassified Sinorhizobium]|uniref:hypothetical protein n=1 Tax=unclassified Sinorhizobium TaxID=2613772 RepID=UPI0024C37CE5|nr:MULTISPECIES: hypothetical protein [unclassified Sinorhizobium]MDK1375983.1 hypothetical protein [Sinorhizobium sp. 6-70]MDK1477237.1 hypothetical protein [Sinorhizobium sp. 6-117]